MVDWSLVQNLFGSFCWYKCGLSNERKNKLVKFCTCHFTNVPSLKFSKYFPELNYGRYYSEWLRYIRFKWRFFRITAVSWRQVIYPCCVSKISASRCNWWFSVWGKSITLLFFDLLLVDIYYHRIFMLFGKVQIHFDCIFRNLICLFTLSKIKIVPL